MFRKRQTYKIRFAIGLSINVSATSVGQAWHIAKNLAHEKKTKAISVGLVR